MGEVKLSIFGFGNVGMATVRVLLEKERVFKEKYGVSFKVVNVSDRSGTVWLPEGIDLREVLNVKEAFGRLSAWSNDYEVYEFSPMEGVKEIDADIVIDVTNDKNAWEWHMEALKRGRAVVTSNKPPLAFHYAELTAEAQRRGLPYLFEATVMAGTPVIGLLRETLLADSIEGIEGVLNGTTTYILTKMEEGVPLEEALKGAQRLGIAEHNPSDDILGFDAGYKATILHCLAFEPITFDEIEIRGIDGLPLEDVQRIRKEGKTLRLVASIERGSVSVEPKELPKESPLAVSSTQNVALIKTDLLGELLIRGAGAGLKETASGVVSDILKAAIRLRGG